jgi:hypothetical protein
MPFRQQLKRLKVIGQGLHPLPDRIDIAPTANFTERPSPQQEFYYLLHENTTIIFAHRCLDS